MNAKIIVSNYIDKILAWYSLREHQQMWMKKSKYAGFNLYELSVYNTPFSMGFMYLNFHVDTKTEWCKMLQKLNKLS